MASDKAPALTEGLRILELVTETQEAVSFENIMKHVSMSRSSVDRLLKTLVNSGYLFTGPGKRDGYRPGIRLFSMAINTIEDVDIIKHIQKMMNSISEEYDVSLQYAIYDRQCRKIIIQCKSESIDTLHVAGYGQEITPYAHRHALGKAILAFCPEEEGKFMIKNGTPEQKTKKTIMPGLALDKELKKIRKEGMSRDNEESLSGVFRLALPIFDQSERISGAVGAAWINSPAKPILNAVKNKLHNLVNLIR